MYEAEKTRRELKRRERIGSARVMRENFFLIK